MNDNNRTEENVQPEKIIPAEESVQTEGDAQAEGSASAVKNVPTNAQAKEQMRFPLLPVAFCAAVAAAAASIYFIVQAFSLQQGYYGDRWYEDTSRIGGTLPEVISFETGSESKSAVSDRWNYGNTPELYAFSANAAKDAENYYLANPADENRLYRISVLSPHESTKLTDLQAENLSVLDGRVYFINRYTASGKPMGIYSIGTDGENLQFLLEAAVRNLQIVNDWLYYISEGDQSIRKLNINDRREVILEEASCESFQVVENDIFYISEYNEEKESGKLMRMNVDGEDKTEICRIEDSSQFFIKEGRLYHIEMETGYEIVSPETGELLEKHKLEGIISSLQFEGENALFIDRKDDRSIAVYQPENSKFENLSIHSVQWFCLFDDLIIIVWNENATELCVSANRLSTGETVGLFR